MMKTTFLTAALALALTATSCADSNSDTAQAELLFIQTAEGGVLTDSTLTLTGVSPQTGWFTDRPNRAAGQIRTEDFVLAWDQGGDSFADDPPNADFSCEVDEETVNYVVELMDPNLEGDVLTYEVESVGDRALPAALECESDSHLFIDSGVCEYPAGKDCNYLSAECYYYLICRCFSADTSDIANDSDEVIIGTQDMTNYCRYKRCDKAGGSQEDCQKFLPPPPTLG